ncbi:MAG: hypothetical protein HQ518_27515 [Rhodopirellula sp.]|nr:hypothetical protein [Rhodopirellula sp.]
MARRFRQQSSVKPAPRRKPADVIARELSPGFRWQDWAISFLMLISVAPDGPFQTVRILPAATSAVLAPEWAWDPPVARISALQPIAECPYWLYAIAMSLLITQFLTKRKASSASGVRFGFLIALSILARPVDFAAATIIVVTTIVLRRVRSDGTSLQAIIGLTTAVVASVLFCLDFSIVLLVLLTCWIRDGRADLSVRIVLGFCASLAVVCGLAALCSPGFAAALARPFTWVTVSEDLLPMSPAAGSGFTHWLSIGLVVFVVSHSWWRVWNADNRQVVLRLVPLAVFTWLCLTCRYYQWVSLLGIVCLTDFPQAVLKDALDVRRVRWSAVPLAILFLSPQFESYQTLVLTGRWPRQFVNAETWETSGRVLLMQLEFSADWRIGGSRENFDLIVDDRWDLFRHQYGNYQQVCRDLRDVRSSRYLRSDGTWGGYKQWIEQWKPTLLVVDSSDLDAIRRLSLSPHWKLMGIDSHRTVFGADGDAKNTRQYQTAARLISELEWPSPQFDGSFGNVLAGNGDAARTQIAQVLLSMRLPYASLRVMPESIRQDDRLVAMCHFEIAHRVFRHTRRYSLVDQYRAIYHLRHLLASGRLTAQQVVRVSRGLEALDEPETAVAFAATLSGQSAPAVTQEQQWAAQLISRCESQTHDGARVISATSDDPETLIRRAMRAGDQDAVTKSLKRLDGGDREFFQVLADSVRKTPEDVYRELIDLLNRSDFSAERRGEALFYLGSLAIEIGDSPGASNAFSASIQAAPAQPLNSISRISLRNLQKPAR